METLNGTLVSKGPGRVERAIADVFEAEPDNAFTVEDLCDRVYPGEPVEKKHRVAVLRAAKNIAKRNTEIGARAGECLGASIVFYNKYHVLSYAMARLKTDRFNRYRSNDSRDTYTGWNAIYGDPGKGMVWRIKHHNSDEEELLARLSEGGSYHEFVVPGGAWWRHTQIRIAERDGDTETAERLRAEGKAEFGAIFGRPSQNPAAEEF
jgi:hypothetical protein